MSSLLLPIGRPMPTMLRNAVRSFGSSTADRKNFVSRILDRYESPTEQQNPPRETVYEMQFHHLRPGQIENYLHAAEEELPRITENEAIPRHLLASWTVDIGAQDTAIHLWSYPAGFKAVHEAKKVLGEDKQYVAYIRRQAELMRDRRNQILVEFSFWNCEDMMASCEPGGIFELRSYQLKPGTLMDWGHEWSRGIVKRMDAQDKPVGGWYSQIGDLYMVHHLWSYQNLQIRKEVRESAWQQPGWEEVVARTVPLVRWMESSILTPTSYSPLR
ncbi:protein NipSnap homolog 2-like [Sycon ciliatum]|uniref:protein NipSnap homolog 2-like n=1 Tax=Sycon ciliatum TaxID=27933 RepID=UPI0020ABFAE2|eukprot:scpid78014/ scgid27771/ Protein NipSnap homolog 2; Glioblastoma-amplified sequence